MNEQPKQPRYFRLLEQGDRANSQTDLISDDDKLRRVICNFDILEKHLVLRPVICDEWISYAEHKPTREDFEPTREVQIALKGAGIVNANRECHNWSADTWNGTSITHWRRITPPEQPRPKSAKVKLAGDDGHCAQIIVVHADGHATTPCGNYFSAESIDEFIKQRELVMRKE